MRAFWVYTGGGPKGDSVDDLVHLVQKRQRLVAEPVGFRQDAGTENPIGIFGGDPAVVAQDHAGPRQAWARICSSVLHARWFHTRGVLRSGKALKCTVRRYNH